MTEKEALLIAYCGPAVALVSSWVIGLSIDSYWGGALFIAAALTGWAWPLVARSRCPSARANITAALNVQLSIVGWIAVGAVLTLFFIGLLVFLAVAFAQVTWAIDAGRRIINDGEIPPRPLTRTFVH
jgi:hypothetical protein